MKNKEVLNLVTAFKAGGSFGKKKEVRQEKRQDKKEARNEKGIKRVEKTIVKKLKKPASTKSIKRSDDKLKKKYAKRKESVKKTPAKNKEANPLKYKAASDVKATTVKLNPKKDFTSKKATTKAPTKKVETKAASKKAAGGGSETVSALYERMTGKKWATAKAEGLTSGSYSDNLALRKKLLAEESTGAVEATKGKSTPKAKSTSPKKTATVPKKETAPAAEKKAVTAPSRAAIKTHKKSSYKPSAAITTVPGGNYGATSQPGRAITPGSTADNSVEFINRRQIIFDMVNKLTPPVPYYQGNYDGVNAAPTQPAPVAPAPAPVVSEGQPSGYYGSQSSWMQKAPTESIYKPNSSYYGSRSSWAPSTQQVVAPAPVQPAAQPAGYYGSQSSWTQPAPPASQPTGYYGSRSSWVPSGNYGMPEAPVAPREPRESRGTDNPRVQDFISNDFI